MSLSKLTLRFAHFPSRAPIMLELQVDPNTTVGQLRALVEEKLATEDHCLVRVFARWYLEMRAGEVRRFSELTDADGGSVLSAVGIEDECELYLEGPVIDAGQDSVGKALAIVSMQGRQAREQQTSLVLSLLDEIQVLKETQAMQGDILRSLREAQLEVIAKQTQQTKTSTSQHQKLATQIDTLVATQKKQQQQLNAIAASQTKQSEDARLVPAAIRDEINALKWSDRVNSLLVKHSGMPLKALWEALNDKGSSVELAMAIVLDKRCGLELRSTLADGDMESSIGFVMNDEMGGLTPLIMAVLAGRVDVMEALLVAGADVHAKEDLYCFSSLDVAAFTNNPALIELLVSYGADVNAEGHSPLHQAAWNGNLEAIEMLLAKGANISKVNSNGYTPLREFDLRVKALTWKSQAVKARIRQLLTPKKPRR